MHRRAHFSARIRLCGNPAPPHTRGKTPAALLSSLLFNLICCLCMFMFCHACGPVARKSRFSVEGIGAFYNKREAHTSLWCQARQQYKYVAYGMQTGQNLSTSYNNRWQLEYRLTTQEGELGILLFLGGTLVHLSLVRLLERAWTLLSLEELHTAAFRRNCFPQKILLPSKAHAKMFMLSTEHVELFQSSNTTAPEGMPISVKSCATMRANSLGPDTPPAGHRVREQKRYGQTRLFGACFVAAPSALSAVVHRRTSRKDI